MAYIFKQKLHISELVDIKSEKKKILIHEPEQYLSALYGSHLRAHNFIVEYCPDVEILESFARTFSPHLVIFSLDGYQEFNKVNWLSKFTKNFPSVLVVTTGLNTNAEVLKTVMSSGILSHINRRLSRPQDLAYLVKTLLKN